MGTIDELLKKNQSWANKITENDPEFFTRLAKQQRPEYLWIGCSDSRVPANQIVDLQPGEVFVHRNIANLVLLSDLNCLSVIEFAVEFLKVKHIIVCGHYGCGGVAAAMSDRNHGLVDYWVWNIKLTYQKYQDWLETLPGDRVSQVMCELNVVEQVHALSRTHILQDAWRAGNPVRVHSWVYDINDGILRDLEYNCGHTDNPEKKYLAALERVKASP